MAKTQSTANATRQAILAAANQVVLREGVGALTLDAVARAAGVSKGGLLYHFPSKNALIMGMIDAMNDTFDQEMAARMQTTGDHGPGAWLRAYIHVSCFPNQVDADLSAGLLAAIATNPELLTPIRERFVAWQQRAEADGLDPALATLIRLAADGLLFSEQLYLAPPPDPLRAQVVQALIDLTRQQRR